MSFHAEARDALSRIDSKKIASTDQQLRHAQILALLAISEELSALREAAGDPANASNRSQD